MAKSSSRASSGVSARSGSTFKLPNVGGAATLGRANIALLKKTFPKGSKLVRLGTSRDPGIITRRGIYEVRNSSGKPIARVRTGKGRGDGATVTIL